MESKGLPPFLSDLKIPEGYILVRTPYPDGSIDYDIRLATERNLLNGVSRGKIYSHSSELNPEELITMTSELEPELQRKGLGRQIYKQAEIDTGKKIIPDMMLSDKSASLHSKYGLGKEFGLSSYEEAIKKGIEKKVEFDNSQTPRPKSTLWTGKMLEDIDSPPAWPPEVAKKHYETMKKIFKDTYGMDTFKSILPFLKTAGKIGIPAAGAAISPSADAAVMDLIPAPIMGDLGVSDEQKKLDALYLNRIKELQNRRQNATIKR